MNDEQTLTLWLGSFRYYLGRRTYAASEFCQLLIQEWDNLPERTQKLIECELEYVFDKDECQRKVIGSTVPYALGMDCDRAEWEKVRKLYKEE